ncbi:MAG: matrixin family metalloprotease [Pirellulaceae bacterium]
MKRQSKNKRRLAIQSLENRRVLAASVGWDGPGLGGATLTYNISGSPESLSQAETSAAIESAFAAWSAVADIEFVPTSQRGLRDSIDISFQSIDGQGGTLAQAYLPDDVNSARIAGDIEFDIAEGWEVGNALGNRAFDLVWVAVHEIGHSLGLDHLDASGSVLSQFVSPNQQFQSLDAAEINAIQSLYAAPSDVVTLTVDTPVDPETPPVDTNGENSGDDSSDPDTNTTPQDDNRNNRRRRRGGGSFHRGGRFGSRLGSDIAEEHNLYSGSDVNNDETVTPLDALLVLNRLADGEFDPTSLHFCDTNGDGDVTPSDALQVLNDLADPQAESQDAAVEASGDPTTIGEDDAVADETPVDETDDVPVVDVVPDTEVVNEDDEVVVEDDSQDTTDDVDSDDADAEDGSEEQEDEENGHCDDESSELGDHPFRGHHRGGHHRGGHGSSRLAHSNNPEALISKFDANADGGLTEDEVSTHLWEHFVAQNVDADADGVVTLTELEAAATAVRAERFAAKDTDGDGLLQESEVSSRFWTRVSAADTNEDGGVSLEELDTWVAQRQADSLAQQAANEQAANEQAGDSSTNAGDQTERFQRHADRLFSRMGRRR